MSTKPVNLLPKMRALPGAVCAQYRRCGKPNCRCRDGISLHGPYFHHYVRQGGKLRKRYIRRAEVEEMQQACQRYRQQQARQRQERTASRELLQSMRQLLREMGGSE